MVDLVGTTGINPTRTVQTPAETRKSGAAFHDLLAQAAESPAGTLDLAARLADKAVEFRLSPAAFERQLSDVAAALDRITTATAQARATHAAIKDS